MEKIKYKHWSFEATKGQGIRLGLELGWLYPSACKGVTYHWSKVSFMTVPTSY